MPVRLPASIRRAAEDLARRDGVSLDQFVATAVAEKVSALTTVDYFRARAARADRAAFDALLAAAGRAGVGRIVHASSIVVYDDWPGGDAEGRIDEDSPRHGTPASGYRAAKLAM